MAQQTNNQLKGQHVKTRMNSFDSIADQIMTEDDLMAKLNQHGPSFVRQHVFDVVPEAIDLIRRHANALATLGMEQAANDLFVAIRLLKPLPPLVSAMDGHRLSEAIRQSQSTTAGLLALAVGGKLGEDIAEQAAEMGKPYEYTPMGEG